MKPLKRSRWLAFSALLAVFVLVAAACGNDDDSSQSEATAAPATAAPTAAADPPDESTPEPTPEATPEEEDMPEMAAPVTQGPNGEPASPSGEISLTADELSQIQEGGYTAALLWHISGAFTNAVSQGARDAFAEMGIEVVVETEAGFDAVQQANDVETAMALNPDIILSLTIDPVSAAEGFRPAVDAGVQLVFLSTTPEGYAQGEEFVGVVTDDLAAMGIAAANLLGNALGGEGEIGFIFHDAPFYVTNQRDQAFKSWIEINFPDIQIVAEQGLADPAAAEDIASTMLTRNPGLDGIYAPWSAGPADGVLAALRAAGASDVAVVTMDLDTNVSLDLVEGGNMVGIAADEAYEIGRTMATEGAYGLLGKEAPPFVVVPAIEVTADNIVEAYRVSLAADPPQEVLDALGG